MSPSGLALSPSRRFSARIIEDKQARALISFHSGWLGLHLPQIGERIGMARSSSNRTVYRRDDGSWANKKNGAGRASSLHDTQGEAAETAKEMLENQGGGELTIIGRDRLIRSKDTIAAPDPNPPRDTEH